MTFLFVVLIVAVVLGISWFAVRRAEALLLAREPTSLFEFDEAVEFIATALPDEMSADIGYDDVEAVVAAHLAYLQTGAGDPERVLVDDAVVDAVQGRVAAAHPRVDTGHVEAILEAEVSYLAAVGAIGDPADPSN